MIHVARSRTSNTSENWTHIRRCEAMVVLVEVFVQLTSELKLQHARALIALTGLKALPSRCLSLGRRRRQHPLGE